jgi:hypothetical protein
MEIHKNLTFWHEYGMNQIAGELMKEDKRIMEAYN